MLCILSSNNTKSQAATQPKSFRKTGKVLLENLINEKCSIPYFTEKYIIYLMLFVFHVYLHYYLHLKFIYSFFASHTF